MKLTAGAKLGPYEILALIGSGAMGDVYSARDTRLDRGVAIKVLPPVFARDPDRLARFEREARAVAAINHPNILAVHDIGSADVAGADSRMESCVSARRRRQRRPRARPVSTLPSAGESRTR